MNPAFPREHDNNAVGMDGTRINGLMSQRLPTAETFESMLHELAQLLRDKNSLPEEDTPLGKATRLFFRNNWTAFTESPLCSSPRIRVLPDLSSGPRFVDFEIDCPYKRKTDSDAPIELVAGPVHGTIAYSPTPFSNPNVPAVAIRLRDRGYFHPNFSRRHGLLCLGHLRGPVPLDILIENYIFPIISYQNRTPSDPADLEAARYFALDPYAMDGLEPVEPLY